MNIYFALVAPLDFCDTIDDGTASEGPQQRDEPEGLVEVQSSVRALIN